MFTLSIHLIMRFHILSTTCVVLLNELRFTFPRSPTFPGVIRRRPSSGRQKCSQIIAESHERMLKKTLPNRHHHQTAENVRGTSYGRSDYPPSERIPLNNEPSRTETLNGGGERSILTRQSERASERLTLYGLSLMEFIKEDSSAAAHLKRM